MFLIYTLLGQWLQKHILSLLYHRQWHFSYINLNSPRHLFFMWLSGNTKLANAYATPDIMWRNNANEYFTNKAKVFVVLTPATISTHPTLTGYRKSLITTTVFPCIRAVPSNKTEPQRQQIALSTRFLEDSYCAAGLVKRHPTKVSQNSHKSLLHTRKLKRYHFKHTTRILHKNMVKYRTAFPSSDLCSFICAGGWCSCGWFSPRCRL